MMSGMQSCKCMSVHPYIHLYQDYSEVACKMCERTF